VTLQNDPSGTCFRTIPGAGYCALDAGHDGRCIGPVEYVELFFRGQLPGRLPLRTFHRVRRTRLDVQAAVDAATR
jgi:hypothetical protein